MSHTQRSRIYQEVSTIRGRQPNEDLPDGTGGAYYAKQAASTRRNTALHGQNGILGRDTILLEKVFAALAEKEPGQLRIKLIDLLTSTVAWVEDIDERRAKEDRTT